MGAMTTITHLRGIPALRALRGRHPAVVVCLDDPAAFEERIDELEGLDAKLVVERAPGPLSARLGRPSVTVSDRYLEVALRGARRTRGRRQDRPPARDRLRGVPAVARRHAPGRRRLGLTRR